METLKVLSSHPEKRGTCNAVLERSGNRFFHQYVYHYFNANLFSILAKTLEECRQRQDEWLKTQK